jgi:preprotein translocase subunit YajC
MANSTLVADKPVDNLVTEGSPYASMAPLLLIVVVFYFLLIRPNQKKIKEQELMFKALRRGDKIVTGGGVIGVIQKIEGDDVLVIEVAPDIKIRVMRDTISHVVSKTVANDNQADEKTT